MFQAQFQVLRHNDGKADKIPAFKELTFQGVYPSPP